MWVWPHQLPLLQPVDEPGDDIHGGGVLMLLIVLIVDYNLTLIISIKKQNINTFLQHFWLASHIYALYSLGLRTRANYWDRFHKIEKDKT